MRRSWSAPCSATRVTIGGASVRKTEFVTFGVALVDPDPAKPPPVGYAPLDHDDTLWFASDNPSMAQYYRATRGVPASAAVYDAQLSIKMPGEGDSGEVKVDAPAAPSPFKMTQTVGGSTSGH